MTAQEANEKLTGELHAVIRDAEELLKLTGGQSGEQVSAVRTRLNAAMDSARATARKVQEKAIAAAKATDHVIREHPYESMGVTFGVAFGVGLLVGVLVARK
jgi:ElaB/YqjD/DUF883 family membrane-anchored ribosome-binding protein